MCGGELLVEIQRNAELAEGFGRSGAELAAAPGRRHC